MVNRRDSDTSVALLAIIAITNVATTALIAIAVL
jgi:hypothetical protein